MTAVIQLARGTDEEASDVKLTRSKDGTTGTATFIFKEPKCMGSSGGEITGMFMIDEEGELSTRNVNGKFVNGKSAGVEAIYTMDGADQWDRFMRFMDRYAEANGMGFTKK
jgi:photosystem II protein